MKKILEWVKPILIAVLIAYCVNSFVIVNAIIPTGSMEDTISINDRLIAFRLSYLFVEPNRGDIVIFDSNYEEKLLVKRIIGTPGDTIEINNNQVIINGEVLTENYLSVDTNGDFDLLTVPEDSYFMLGDNRNKSNDSRFWENHFISSDAIKGKVMFRYFPNFKLFGGNDGQ